MADRSIDQAKANAWIEEVQEEIELVNKVLRDDVPNVISDVPGNDTFTNMLKETNNFLTTSWNAATKGFTEGWKKVEGVIKEIHKRGEIVVGVLGEFDEKAKNK